MTPIYAALNAQTKRKEHKSYIISLLCAYMYKRKLSHALEHFTTGTICAHYPLALVGIHSCMISRDSIILSSFPLIVFFKFLFLHVIVGKFLCRCCSATYLLL